MLTDASGCAHTVGAPGEFHHPGLGLGLGLWLRLRFRVTVRVSVRVRDRDRDRDRVRDRGGEILRERPHRVLLRVRAHRHCHGL